MDRKKECKDTSVPILPVDLFFPRVRQKLSNLEAVEDFCKWGISLDGIAPQLGYETASGALKFLHGVSDKALPDVIFDLFRPASTEIVHLDEIKSWELKKPVFRWFVRGSGENKVAYAWGLTRTRNFMAARSIVDMTIRHNHGDPKIWVSDGLPEYHTALISKYGKNRVRTVFLDRNPEKKIDWFTNDIINHIYSISKEGNALIVSKGLSKQRVFYQVADRRHYTTTIRTILSLFRKYDASCVYIQASEKTLPFHEFSQRFLKQVRRSRFICHFIGHCTNGNTTAEIFAHRIAHRNSWFDEQSHSTKSSRKIFNLQMVVYNLFTKLKCLGRRSAFESAGARTYNNGKMWNMMLYSGSY